MAERIVPERFLDAGEEPEQTLTPIHGYEKVPLVSLKEAIEPIKSLLYNADIMVEIAKRNSRKPADDLTSDESAAIHLYTMQWPQPNESLYTLLNKNLRSKNRETLVSWFCFLKLFLTALYKLPSIKSTIWRGVRGNLSSQYDADQIWWGASSCTETMKTMEAFVGTSGVRTLFTIECINGRSISAHSYFKDENEILLMPGSYFKVVDKWSPAKDLYIIHLREMTPPFLTVASPFYTPSASATSQGPMNSNDILLLDENLCDKQYDKDFTNIDDKGKSFTRGGLEYRRPCGWKRFAIKVVGKYENEIWLGSDNSPGEWAVSYHGTKQDTVRSIAQTGYDFTNKKRFLFERGIYTTPNINTAKLYASTFTYNGEEYYVVLQNRVNPETLIKIDCSKTGDGDFWISPSPDDIRLYGYCIMKKS
ncbi:unnamed protein product [Adineta steineri]|uniref:NAD(P)(+)--arginine ADP-ribosyltransferase n=1 Tax=Adineta steineri TaxID=433720 RepID=A0A815QSF3_9BILA|nr:unnamed protein product [Adineta steineri]CAF4086485.1 unnamed protein product [Adineta steineri]